MASVSERHRVTVLDTLGTPRAEIMTTLERGCLAVMLNDWMAEGCLTAIADVRVFLGEFRGSIGESVSHGSAPFFGHSAICH